MPLIAIRKESLTWEDTVSVSHDHDDESQLRLWWWNLKRNMLTFASRVVGGKASWRWWRRLSIPILISVVVSIVVAVVSISSRIVHVVFGMTTVLRSEIKRLRKQMSQQDVMMTWVQKFWWCQDDNKWSECRDIRSRVEVKWMSRVMTINFEHDMNILRTKKAEKEERIWTGKEKGKECWTGK